MERNKPVILFGAGGVGKEALDYYGAKNVHFFADNYKAGLYYYGIPVISANELLKIHSAYEVIISTLPSLSDEIMRQLDSIGIHGASPFDPVYKNEIYERNPHLEKFKNIHAGERCFLIGNGPSLRADDLDRIARYGGISFAANKIYKIYSETQWRPDYHFVTDPTFIAQRGKEMAESGAGVLMVGNHRGYRLPGTIGDGLASGRDCQCFMVLELQWDPVTQAVLPRYAASGESFPQFSGDPSKYVYEGLSVTYNSIQWAAYMGFSEIFLLGVDFNYKKTWNYLETAAPPQEFSGETAGEHFCRDYLEKGELVYMPDMGLTGQAYEKAEQYSREHSFRIYNATRGGKLEAFERVDFDELIGH